MLLVPLLLALVNARYSRSSNTEATPYIDTPHVCTNIQADIYCCNALTISF